MKIILKIKKPLLILAFLLLPISLLLSQDTYLDNFNTISYSNSDGNQTWSTNWIEIDPGGSTPVSGGRITITSNQLRFRRLTTSRSISRVIDLSTYSSVTLDFDFDGTNRGDEILIAQLWNNTSNTWETIATINSSTTGAIATYTLTTDQISANSEIRFLSNSGDWDNPETIFIDNVLFTATAGPQLSINDVTVNENAGTAVFTVTHSGNDTAGSFTVDFATSNNTAFSGTDYTAISSPPSLTFSGIAGETQTISVPIIDDIDIEVNQTFFIDISNVSDPTVLINDAQGIGTIIDNDTPFIITDGVTINTCSGVFTDTGSTTGSYSNNEAITYTICPDGSGSAILMNFSEFDVENNFDALAIYEGTTTTTLIGTYDNLTPAKSIISTDPSGCLTFIFTSDNTVQLNGWTASISCPTSLLTVDNITVNETAGTATFTITLSGSSVGSSFNVDYTTTDNTAFADSDYTTTSGTLTFSGTVGQTQTVTVPILNNSFGEADETFFLDLINVTDSSVGLFSGTGTITDDGDTAILDNVPLTLFDNFSGYYDYAVTAGSLRTMDNSVDPCAITDSSSNTLTTPIPPGSTIRKAYLLWAHSNIFFDDAVTFEGQTVYADYVNSSGGAAYFGMISDVTTIIQGIADPSTNIYDFSDLVIDNKSYCGTVVFGGWSLMIFYSNPAFTAVSINMYDGFDIQQNTTNNYTLGGFFAIGGSGAKTSVLSWEGDPDLSGGEVVTLTTTSGTNTLNGDGDNTGGNQNVFNSTIYDNTAVPIINDSSLYGLDLDTYDISPFISTGESSATTNIQVGGDLVILNSVLLKVPSNLITGTVFEDLNYGGGSGRNLATASGVGISGVTVELYDNAGSFMESVTTDSTGKYTFGGMSNGLYTIRVVNNTVRSTRGGGTACTSCMPIQTFKSSFSSSTLTDITNEIGGANPALEDVVAGTLIGAQTTVVVDILNEGAVDLDFGFNFNTIVNSNQNGQGSLEQFIINANNLDEIGLDIEANSLFDPGATEDTSIFMIPSDTDPLGRAPDANFASGYFDIFISNSIDLSTLTDANTHIDGRSQTAYSGNTNTGTIGNGGANIGTTTSTLPNYDLPEIQIHQNNGDVFQIQADNTTIRNIAIYANNNAGITVQSGSVHITENLLGVNATGVNAGNINYGVEITGGAMTIDGNYISTNTNAGILVNGGTSTNIENNHITNNGNDTCTDNITLQSGTGITIQRNLIENAAAIGIDGNGISGNVTITDNTIQNSGQNGGDCSGSIESAGIRLGGNNSTLTNNKIHTNGGTGITLVGGNTSGNLISQNSIYNNGTITNALGIDIDQNTVGNAIGDGVTLNDSGDTDNGPNTSINFPVVESATIIGTQLNISGWSIPGATIEIFITDISEGTAGIGDNQLGLTQNYGEGQTYIGSVIEGSAADLASGISSYTDVDGNTDTTNQFSFSIAIPTTYPNGTLLTTTATVANTTSEFSNIFSVGIKTVITNRRITYRVKPN